MSGTPSVVEHTPTSPVGPQPGSRSRHLGRRGRFVVVVDDNELFRGMLFDRLVDLGCEVALAANGREAFKILTGRTEPASLLILDL